MQGSRAGQGAHEHRYRPLVQHREVVQQMPCALCPPTQARLPEQRAGSSQPAQEGRYHRHASLCAHACSSRGVYYSNLSNCRRHIRL